MLSTGKRGAQKPTNGPAHDRNQWRSAAERYEVLGRAGEGTLVAVYRVRDKASGRILALKALKNAFVKHPRLTATLARAMEANLPLNNPYLARVSDVGVAEGTLYFVQEWLQGKSLEERLRQAPLPHNETLLFTRQIAEALNFLHNNNIAHGDVRPRQIWLTSGTHLKIADAGVGSALHEAGIALFDVQQDAAHFLAPERFDGAPPSASADFYALGVILYHMLTGRVPFDGTSPLIIAARHRSDEPLRPSQFNPDCSPQLEELALCLLDKHPTRRYQQGQELLRRMGGGGAGVYQSPYTALTPQGAAPVVEEPVTPVAPPQRPVAAPVIEEFEPEIEPLAPKPQGEVALDLKLEKKKHRKREFKSALLALFWLIVSAGLLFGMVWLAINSWMAQIPPNVRVPQYVKLKRNDAERILAQAGLHLKVGSEKYNPKVPEDTVLSGDPPPGKLVRQGREVLVVLSKGEEPITMYDFSELSLKRAREIITRDGMRLGIVSEQFHDRIPSGYVCGQYPEPGAALRRSEPINLTVSKGPPPSSDVEDTLSPDDGEPSVPMVSRSIQVRVALPKGGDPQEVKIIVNDANGEDVVYEQTHEPGDLIDETVRVRRQQGTTAKVQIYIGGKLFKEDRI
jgi:eukaryotic-like serine/threonine-protein kinase